jgi:acetyl esterase/lipase
VVHHPQHLRAPKQTMASATYSVKILKGLTYSHVGGVPRLADLFLPLGMDRPAPVILWVHGGGWRFGDRNLAPDLSRWFAERGFAMVSFEYRLSDEAKFPDPVADVKTAVRWVRSIAQEYSLDADAIGLWGSSAGAHLSACAALSGEQFITEEHSGFSSTVNAVVDGYGSTDFSRVDEDRLAAPPKIPDAETVVVELTVPTAHPDSFESRLIGVTVQKGAPEVDRANPVNYVHSASPPFLILHGESDALVPWTQSQLLYEALAKAGSEVTLVKYQRLGHGFFNNSDLDGTELGPATAITSTDPRGPVTSSTLKVFALCEEFFRFYLAERGRSFKVRFGTSLP